MHLSGDKPHYPELLDLWRKLGHNTAMKTLIPLIVSISLLVLVVFGILQYFAVLPMKPISVVPQVLAPTQNEPLASEVPLTTDIFAENLVVPWSMIFTSPDRMLISERSGSIREVRNGVLQTTPLYRFTDVPQSGEEGLMSLVLDPQYAENKWLYAAVAYQNGDNLAVKVVRLTDAATSLENPQTIIENIPAGRFHAGTDMRFGPDGKLYVSTGDSTQRDLAQQLDSLAGKILRLNSDGSIPSDNPISGSPIYSIGHRNPQGLAFQPGTGRLYETEHGPSLFDGPAGGDEINLIQAGQNYGWPLLSHERAREGFMSPLKVFTPAVAPASAEFYDADVIPQFRGSLFFGALAGEGLYQV